MSPWSFRISFCRLEINPYTDTQFEPEDAELCIKTYRGPDEPDNRKIIDGEEFDFRSRGKSENKPVIRKTGRIEALSCGGSRGLEEVQHFCSYEDVSSAVDVEVPAFRPVETGHITASCLVPLVMNGLQELGISLGTVNEGHITEPVPVREVASVENLAPYGREACGERRTNLIHAHSGPLGVCGQG